MSDAPALLAGITVLDFTRVLAGPCCTRLLADLGVRIIKEERPRYADTARAEAALAMLASHRGWGTHSGNANDEALPLGPYRKQLLWSLLGRRSPPPRWSASATGASAACPRSA